MSKRKQTETVLTVTTDRCKPLADPRDPSVHHLEVFVPFDEAVKLTRGTANVRPPNEAKPAYKAMLATVETAPELFHRKNRGITYICDAFQYDGRDKTLRIINPKDDSEDGKKFGIADGGHTFGVIQSTMKRLSELQAAEGWEMPFVRIHLVANDEAEEGSIEEIVEALNVSAQVQQFTLDEYGNKFDELKAALEKASFDTSLIAFRENEDKDWHVIEIIQRMSCFLKDRWRTTQPASMYRSKGKALQLYTNDATRPEFRKLYRVIKDVITLPEYIQSEFSSGDYVDLRSHSRLKPVKVLTQPWTRPGTSYATKYRLDMAALLPMASAFRELLKVKGDRYEWRVDPKEVFKKCAKDLHQLLVARVRHTKTISQLGADMEYWSLAATIVTNTMMSMLDEKAA